MRHFPIWIAVACLALASGCAHNKEKEEKRVRLNPLDKHEDRTDRRIAALSAEELYASAKEALDSGDADEAIKLYEKVESRFPFTKYATQAQLDMIYAQHRAHQPEVALSSANRFIKQHPQHPEIDYVYYLRGLVNFERREDEFDKVLQIDGTRRDPVYARTSFEDFSLLIKRYPDSKYAQDARKRMIYLREGLGRYELHVADYYIRRKAWVAASRRAQYVVEHYQGTHNVAPALDILEQCYRELGLEDRAKEAHAILAANYPDYLKAPGSGQSKWNRWLDKWAKDPLITVFD